MLRDQNFEQKVESSVFIFSKLLNFVPPKIFSKSRDETEIEYAKTKTKYF